MAAHALPLSNFPPLHARKHAIRTRTNVLYCCHVCCDPCRIDSWRTSLQMEERAKVKVHKRVQLEWVLATLIQFYGSLYSHISKKSKPFFESYFRHDTDLVEILTREYEESFMREGSRIRLLGSQTLGELRQEGEIRLSLVSKFAPDPVSAYFVRIEKPNFNFVNETGSSMRQEFRIRDDATKEGQGAAKFGIGFMPEHVNLKVMYSSKAYTDDVDSLDNQVHAFALSCIERERGLTFAERPSICPAH